MRVQRNTTSINYRVFLLHFLGVLFVNILVPLIIPLLIKVCRYLEIIFICLYADGGDHNTMKFGVQHPNYSFDYTNQDSSQIVDSLKNLVTRAETLGFDSFWVMDHFHQIPFVGKLEEPMLESWTTISVLAGVTSKIKLGTMMTGIIYRHPSILAKIGATLDVLSKGRLFMGIGARLERRRIISVWHPLSFS